MQQSSSSALTAKLIIFTSLCIFWDSSETADYRDLWTKRNNKMTFPHPVWWLIPSKAASPPQWHRASRPTTPTSALRHRTVKLSSGQLGCHGDEKVDGERRLKIANRSDANSGQLAGLQNTPQQETYGALGESSRAMSADRHNRRLNLSWIQIVILQHGEMTREQIHKRNTLQSRWNLELLKAIFLY